MAVLGTYIPQGQFTMNRPYIASVIFQYNADVLFLPLVDGTYAVNPDLSSALVVFKPAWVAPSSNRYTLDWIIDYAVYKATPTSTPVDFPFQLVYHVEPDTGYNVILFQPGGVPGLGYFRYDMPPVPGQWSKLPWNG